MKTTVKILTIITGLVLFLWSGLVSAQDVLPFPPTPSASEAGFTIQSLNMNISTLRYA